ncbi:Glutamyl-tRNA synthetase (EC [Olavius algarvensis associated proteobacterium Delta 3]|nr:Glutamyl-tRNA synthetase (EC [Olavius algarvensis associated proteobacterium Delta 3]
MTINSQVSVMQQIITRFPPSPTGYLHVGGARTALFNWLYARHTKGRLVLRIEDTDVKRSTQASVDAIFEALEWLGIDWDDGPYFQSKRFDIYMDYVDRLLESGNAYYCTCTPERLEDMRKRAMAAGGKPKYDGTCREKGISGAEGAVVRLKAPLTGTTVVEDVVKGNIVFQNAELDDFIICRSDGSPTYNFCVVVDDMTMGINTVIRGDDHVMNTPKQMLIYKALGHELPIYAHVPMVLGPDRTRLSKRHGAMSVTAYRDMGFLPEALVNYLVRLGWSFGDEEFFCRDELIEKFSLENVGTSAGIFDFDKLLSLNAEHMKAMPLVDLSRMALPFFQQNGYRGTDDQLFEKAVETLIPRSKTLEEMADIGGFYFADAIAYDEKAARKFLKSAALLPLERLTGKLEELDTFDEPSLEQVFQAVMEETGLKLGKIAQPVRVALTGKTASPGIFEVISIVGKEKVIARLKDAIAYIQALPS